MRYVELHGLKISKIGLGTWQFGALEWGYGTAYSTHEAGEIVRRALDLGVTLVDTAEIYSFGGSERILGRALAGRVDQAVVATKLFPVAPVPPIVRMRAQASARRLGVSCIDLYQLHWFNPVVPLAVTMPPLGRLQDAGLIGEIGVSNFSLGQWRRAEQHLGRRVLSNQIQFNLVHREPEEYLVPYAEQAGRLVIAYSPLAMGLLAGGYGPDRRPGGIRRGNPLFRPENLERAAPLLDTLREVAAAHHATPAQVALAWVIRRPNVVAIPGAHSVAQVEANTAAADLDLRDDEDFALSEAAGRFRPARLPVTRLGA